MTSLDHNNLIQLLYWTTLLDAQKCIISSVYSLKFQLFYFHKNILSIRQSSIYLFIIMIVKYWFRVFGGNNQCEVGPLSLKVGKLMSLFEYFHLCCCCVYRIQTLIWLKYAHTLYLGSNICTKSYFEHWTKFFLMLCTHFSKTRITGSFWGIISKSEFGTN